MTAAAQKVSLVLNEMTHLANGAPPVTTTLTHPFAGRTVAVVNDLSVAEQIYLYENARRLKETIQQCGEL